MMKKLMVIIAFLYGLTVTAQTSETSSQPKLKISNFSASGGNLSVYFDDLNFDELKNITQNSNNFYTNNIDGFEDQSYNQCNVSSFNVSLGLTPFSKKLNKYKNNREIQIGFTLNSGYRRNFYFYQNESHPIDSITFHGSKIVADSILTSGYDYEESVNDINLSMSYLFKTTGNSRFGAFAGLTADIGFSFFSEVEKYEYTNSYKSISVDGYQTNQSVYIEDQHYNNNQTNESIDNSIFARLALPVGLSYHLSKKDNFLGMIEIFTQGKFGFEYQKISNKYNHLNAMLGISGGLKFSLG